MRIGDLDTRIDLEAKTKAPDGKGGFTSSWQTVIPGIWASIWPLKADERVEAAQQAGVATHRVRIRFRRRIRADWRVKVGTDRYYSICSEPIDLGMRHQFLEMLCREVAK